MIHHNTILKTDTPDWELRYNPTEHPLVLQLGGCDPVELCSAAKYAKHMGYDEINLNVGCPSPRVQCGSFGACLMREPDLVAKCMKQIREATQLPCTVKCRLGVDQQQSYDFTYNFVKKVHEGSGISHFIVHARNAILKGLNPAENRTIPPLKYHYVYKLQRDFPHLQFTLNGGIKTVAQAKQLLDEHKLYGIMIGRTAYQNPWELAQVDYVVYGDPSNNYNRHQVLIMYGQWVDSELEKHPTLSKTMLIKPVLNIFMGERNSSKFRQLLSDPKNFVKYGSIKSLFEAGMKILEETDPQIVHKRRYEPKEKQNKQVDVLGESSEKIQKDQNN